jgi:hypothetical protein
MAWDAETAVCGAVAVVEPVFAVCGAVAVVEPVFAVCCEVPLVLHPHCPHCGLLLFDVEVGGVGGGVLPVPEHGQVPEDELTDVVCWCCL